MDHVHTVLGAFGNDKGLRERCKHQDLDEGDETHFDVTRWMVSELIQDDRDGRNLDLPFYIQRIP
jgi:hypothetical protein